MSMVYNNYCIVLDDNKFEDEDQNSSPNGGDFFIRIHADLTYVPLHIKEEQEDDLLLHDYESCDVYKWFITQRDLLLHEDDESFSTISGMLLDVHVPLEVHGDMIRDILNGAQRVATNKKNVNCAKLAISVYIGVVVFDDNNDDDDDEDNNENVFGADKSAVEALEKVRAKEGVVEDCVICLEEIGAGSEASQMPCSHVFHGGCLVGWLEKSKVCPLCRFEMA